MAQDAARGWRIAAARRTGESHRRRGERGQDAFRVLVGGPNGRALIAVVCDGAGSAQRGGAGAALAARAASQAARATLADARRVADIDDATAAGWALAARARLAAAAGDRPLRDLAATMVLVASDGAASLAVHVGDGAAALCDVDGVWTALSWPEGGAHAGETRFLTEDPPALRVSRVDRPAVAAALLTDGIERLVLDFAAQTPHAPFFERMTRPLERLTRPGRDPGLSAALARWLGGEAVAARTDDDRTLVLAALSGAPA